jgi:CRISPR-associated endonuclease/helicase Cas3
MPKIPLFKNLTNYEPYPHQRETYETLKKGKSIILRAPTGSGKSEAVFIPFVGLRGISLPKRMIYALPMRALVNSLYERFKNYTSDLDIRAQHGMKPESILFNADCVVATLDQVITSYACAPLSLGVRHGNIPAGAIVSSFLVFDEVHTFEPLLGLQCVLIVADRLKKLSVPFVIMSATLPTRFAVSLSERLNALFIEVNEDSISARNKRSVILYEKLDDTLSPEKVLQLHEEHDGSTIVVCNTVDRAINLYTGLKDKVSPIILIHSRFLDADRDKKENEIKKYFGKSSKKKALLLTTQVIEVGMDISCTLLITELAPVDALIQRAGRCVRWGGRGEIIVFNISHHAPYDKTVIDDTKEVIKKYSGKQLTWSLEKTMVDEVLDEYFLKLTEPAAGAKAMMYLSKGAFEGKPATAEKAVRDAVSVEVSIHDNPQDIKENVYLLPKCKLRPESLEKFVREEKPEIWRVEIDRNTSDDYKPAVELTAVNLRDKIYPNKFYVIHSKDANYDSERGFILGEQGSSLKPLRTKEAAQYFNPDNTIKETWARHALKTVEVFERYILPEEEFIYSKLASALHINKDELLSVFKLTLLLHDLGKLTEEWQKGVGASAGQFLAHSEKIEKVQLPPHATVSAYVLENYLKDTWRILGDASFFAIAHHHSVRAAKVPRYRLSDGWFTKVNDVLSDKLGMTLDYNEVKEFETQDCPTQLSHMPAFENDKKYNLYVILSRALRLADRKATAQDKHFSENL